MSERAKDSEYKKKKDVSIFLQEALHWLKEEVEFYECTEIGVEIDCLLSNLEPELLVAFAGEISRGKTAILNSLIKEELFPMGYMPTTSVPTFVRYGKSRCVEAIRKNRARHFLLADLMTIQEFMIDKKASLMYDHLRVSLPDTWLKDTNLCLVDTPGIGSFLDKKNSKIADILAASDAVLVIVSAHMPLSLLERSFIEDQFIFRKDPKIAVVVTHLDEISVKDRLRVLTHIKKRIVEIDEKIEIWLSHAKEDIFLYEENIIHASGALSMREALSSWAKDRKFSFLQIEESLSQVTEIMERFFWILDAQMKKALCVENENIINLDPVSKKTIFNEKIKKDFDLRKEGFYENLSHRIKHISEEVEHEMKHQVLNQNNFDLLNIDSISYVVRKSFLKKFCLLEKILQEKMLQEKEWLESELERFVGERLSFFMFSEKYIEIDGYGESTLALQENIPSKTLSKKMVFAIASTVSYILTGSFGIAVGSLNEIVKEWAKHQEKNRKREQCLQSLPSIVGEARDSLLIETQKRVQTACDKLLETVQKETDLWLQTTEKIRSQKQRNSEKAREHIVVEQIKIYIKQLHILRNQL